MTLKPRATRPALALGREGDATRRSAFTPAAARLAGLAGALLGWSPDTFWRATPAELAIVAAALAGEDAAAPPDAALIARLKEAFPDG